MGFIGGYGRPLEQPLMYLAYALCAEAVLLYIRCALTSRLGAFRHLRTVCRGVYRVVELADGWDGKVIQTQSLFCTLSSARQAPLTPILTVILHSHFRRGPRVHDDAHHECLPPWTTAYHRGGLWSYSARL